MSHQRTADGSFTYVSPHFEETFHSRHGAKTESEHVFIQAGLKPTIEKFAGAPLAVFEMGFGSGLNALLTAMFAEEKKVHIHYQTLETHPIPIEDVAGFRIGDLFEDLEAEKILYALHRAEWEKRNQLLPFFQLLKMQADFTNWNPKGQAFHLVYYDAFAPRCQPELWEAPIAEKLYEMIMPGGLLVTYCAQGQFKRNLAAAGFEVQPLPGPPGKREMTRALRK